MARPKKEKPEKFQEQTEQGNFEKLVVDFIKEIFGENMKIKTVDLTKKENEVKETKKVSKTKKKGLTLDEQLLKINEIIKDIISSNNSDAIQQVEKITKTLEEEIEKNRKLQLELDEVKKDNRSLKDTNHDLNTKIEELEDELYFYEEDEEDCDYDNEKDEEECSNNEEKELNREEKLLKELAEKAHKTRE